MSDNRDDPSTINTIPTTTTTANAFHDWTTTNATTTTATATMIPSSVPSLVHPYPSSHHSTTDNQQPQPQQHRHYLPWLILQIGPPKTATTTLQCSMADTYVGQHLALKDSIWYLGKPCYVGRSLSNGIQHPIRLERIIHEINMMMGGDNTSSNNNNTTANVSDTTTTFTGIQQLQSTLYEHWIQNHSVILSSEGFGSKLIDTPRAYQQLRSILQLHHYQPPNEEKEKDDDDKGIDLVNSNNNRQPTTTTGMFDHFNIKVVITYRHFFEWLPSLYFQSYTINSRERKDFLRYPHHAFVDVANEYISQIQQAQQQQHLRQQTQNHTTVATTNIDSTRHKIMKDGRISFYPTHPALWLYERWKNHFDNVVLFNLHNDDIDNDNNTTTTTTDDDDSSRIVERFVCQILEQPHSTITTANNNRQKQQQLSNYDNNINNSISTCQLLIQKRIGTYQAETTSNGNSTTSNGLFSHQNGTIVVVDDPSKKKQPTNRRQSKSFHAERIVEAAIEQNLVSHVDSYQKYVHLTKKVESILGDMFFRNTDDEDDIDYEGEEEDILRNRILPKSTASSATAARPKKKEFANYLTCLNQQQQYDLRTLSEQFQTTAMDLMMGGGTTKNDPPPHEEQHHRRRQQQQQHDILWDKAKSHGRFCDISTTKILNDSEFLYQFRSRRRRGGNGRHRPTGNNNQNDSKHTRSKN